MDHFNQILVVSRMTIDCKKAVAVVGHHDPGRSIPDPLVDLGGDVAGPVHECCGDQSLHNLRLGLRHSTAADSTGAHRLDARKFNQCGAPGAALLPDASLVDLPSAEMI